MRPYLIVALASAFAMPSAMAAPACQGAPLQILNCLNSAVGQLQAQLTSAQTTIQNQQSSLVGLSSDNASLQARVVALENGLLSDLDGVLYVDNGDIVFHDTNVVIQNGTGTTDGVNGTGNLILGYNEDDGGDIKVGSHNLVLGSNHTYTSYGAIITGFDNNGLGANASIIGGTGNQALAIRSAVIGGTDNITNASNSVVVGGELNTTNGTRSVVVGGYGNAADNTLASLFGGDAMTSLAYKDTLVGGLDGVNLENRIVALETGLVDDLDGLLFVDNGDVVVQGANLIVRNGLGSSDQIDGTGNLIIGYDADDGSDDKSGSHNLVLGDMHSYTSWGGAVLGYDSLVAGPNASVLGGTGNLVTSGRGVVPSMSTWMRHQTS